MHKEILTKAFVFWLLTPAVAFAFRLTPMVIHFSPTGSGTTQVITLENSGGEKVPVQIQVFHRTADKNGEEVRTKSEDFNVYPEQLVLLPNEKRNVRITWAGEVKDKEEAFRVVASQLPVEFKDRNANAKKNGVNLNFLLQYVASAYVTPDGATAKISVKEVLNEKKHLTLHLVNEGTAHRVLKVKSIKIYSGEKIVAELAPGKVFENMNLLAGSEKKVKVDTPQTIADKNLRAVLDLTESGE